MVHKGIFAVKRLTAKFSFKNFDVFRQEEMYLTEAREVSIISVDTKTSPNITFTFHLLQYW